MRIRPAAAIAALALLASLALPAPADAVTGLCAAQGTQSQLISCVSGDTSSDVSVALIGDSHTRSWFGPAEALAAKYGWKLTVMSKSACPPLDPKLAPASISTPSCIPWNRNLEQYLATNPDFDLVINASSSLVTHGYASYGKAFASMAGKITATGASMLVIRDNPKPVSGFATCIQDNPGAITAKCSRDRAGALTPADPMPAAVKGMANIKLADFTDAYCGPKVCPPVIDGITVYKDHSHISTDWALHLTPELDAVIPARFK